MEDLDQLEGNNLGPYYRKMDTCIRTGNILYSRFPHIVNEFMWQTDDQRPDFPRIGRFLNYWDKYIDGPIKEVYIYDHEKHNVRVVDRRYKIN